MLIEIPDDLRYLSELYSADAADACFLAEYPSSNSKDTIFQNSTEFIIHDPFPAPPRELLTSLGPHHLMCCWGTQLPVTSQIAPPGKLLEHWQRTFGTEGLPKWKPYDDSDLFITMFPHQSIPPQQQVVEPLVNYELHSKEIIEQIDCPQAKVYDSIEYPCIVKLSHGYAGLGNYLLRDASDEAAMREELAKHWSDSTLIINSVIENICGDYGVQFYLRRDGSIIWLGLTEQHFNESKRWCGGTYSKHLQTDLLQSFEPHVTATAATLHEKGYFGVVGIDILRDDEGRCFLVDVNPRLTGITPFLMASRIFQGEDSYDEGIYQASFRFNGTLTELISVAESIDYGRVLILSAFERSAGDNRTTICHVSVSSESQSRNREALDQLAKH
ncbi:ATP-grasp domain-containing protein [Mariniblastus fucicola]|uniref:Carbamoyl phosphate synthase-like protein n=1 Tax=Mariniblastus fucicola TaxID=980251 RepID=A0A5B9PB44_9BACT|nr:ATP-grasp domain-containing protein [Mariniblastus fucicola]QEG22200.1 carbamoyl phosphate synthase-like protein [Mariniblastus fucicola]